jgi:hypothetical protein
MTGGAGFVFRGRRALRERDERADLAMAAISEQQGGAAWERLAPGKAAGAARSWQRVVS